MRRAVRIFGWLVLVTAAYLCFTFVDVWMASRSSADTTAEVALVLGAAQYNGEPSPVLQSRLDKALELYSADMVKMVVVTGGNQEGDITTEAKTGYDYLRAAGVPDEDLLLEVKGDSTYASIGASARFLRQREIKSVVLVTDAYHSRRAQLVAGEFGMEPQVSLTGNASFGRLVSETLAVAAGRIVSFRRLDLWAN